MSKLLCSICKREENERSMKSCDNCGKPMCADCYAKHNGNCNCSPITNNSLIDII